MDYDSNRDSQDSFDYTQFQSASARRKLILLKVIALAHPAHLTSLCRRFGYACTPQLFRSIFWDEHAPKPKQFSTSYLNGLRGITAIKVFTFHYVMAYTDFAFVPWKTDERHNRYILLPVFRYFYSGFTSQVFFVVAGYLTSLRLFQLLDKNDVTSQAKVLSTVAASLFRRGFRLYLPVAIITFIMMLYIYSGLYESNRTHIMDHNEFPGYWNETKPALCNTFGQQVEYWAREMYELTDIIKPETFYPDHDQHLWSILSEMRASVHLYGCIIAIATCKRYARLVALCAMTYIFYLWNSWETWVYILGAIVAQIDIILTERDERSPSGLPAFEAEKDSGKQIYDNITAARVPTLLGTKEALSTFIYILVRWTGFLLAIYLMSFPISGPEHFAPGYEILKSLLPSWVERKEKFYPNIGAAILLFLLVRSDPNTSKWRRFLMSSVPQYLGTISFALYLVHGPLLHAFGYMIPQILWSTFGTTAASAGEKSWLSAVVFGWAVSLAISLAVADVWMREVEGRCVKLVKKLEGICFKT